MRLTILFGLLVSASAFAACGGGDDGGSGNGQPKGDAGIDTANGDSGPSCVDTGEHPLPRSETMAAYDPKRKRIVFFGGDTGVPQQCNPAPKPIGELWTYDVECKAFKQITTSNGPSARTRGIAVHDPEADRMIVFGGRFREGSTGAYTNFNDVWALDLETLTWSELTTTGTAPSARSSTAGGYNAQTKELVLFGGNSSTSGLSFTPLDDVWALSLESLAWREIATTGQKPPARLFHSVAIEPKSGTLYVYGGGGAGAFQGPFMSDLWSLHPTTNAWTQESAGGPGAPLGRINASLTFDPDPSSTRVLLFGGHDDGAVGNNNDTWAFAPVTKQWSAITPPEELQTAPPGFCLFPPDFTTPNLNAPDRRSAQLAVLDTAGRRWLIYGGKTDCGIIDDVWQLDLASSTWKREVEASIGEACVRGKYPEQCSTLCI